ncbi:hypothetical protein H072_6471 [Dactylellina haptotyla CBS 200.50]|uniref:Uncharacterized protein n=1 Tax=Dactylellina haptotyla (strain CBS 200.50) TaxID=1284197 RepID=S8BK84_DACHA|nr:hypothetical protein H072_6471 [Dactylellina haptotyla CBS 200.50]
MTISKFGADNFPNRWGQLPNVDASFLVNPTNRSAASSGPCRKTAAMPPYCDTHSALTPDEADNVNREQDIMGSFAPHDSDIGRWLIDASNLISPTFNAILEFKFTNFLKRTLSYSL